MTEEVLDQVEENTEEVVDKIRLAFDDAITEEKPEDDVKLAMIGAGATFKNVTRLFNQYMVEAGYAMSKADRDEKVDEILNDCGLDTEELFDAAITAIVESIPGVNDKSAAALIRHYAKQNEVEVYKKTKTSGRTTVDINEAVCEYMLDKDEFDAEATLEFIKEQKENISEGAIRTYMRHAKRTHAYGLKFAEARS